MQRRLSWTFEMKGKLVLSGGGNEKQTYALDEVFLKDTKKILYIPIAWVNEDFDSCFKWFKNCIGQHKKVEIEMITDLSIDVDLDNYDAVYIGGGNTFKLLKKIRDSGFDKKLLDYLNVDGVVYGGSAGAIIFGRDIEIALICKDKDKNEMKLKDTKGLNLVSDFDIQCHFEDNQIEEHKEFIKKSGRNVICIPEESALFLKNDKIEIIGIKPITVITKEEVKKYNVGEFLDI